MKSINILLLTLFFIFVYGDINATIMRAEASPEISPGKLKTGEPFTIDIYLNNTDGLILGYSLPLSIYSPDQSISNITHRNVDGFGAHSSILMPNSYDTYWTLLNEWQGFSWDGSLADTINHTTASLSGWPDGLGEFMGIQFALQVETDGILCIDSVSIPNVTPAGMYDWLFDYSTTFDGPYCWTFETPPDVAVRAEAHPVNAEDELQPGIPFTIDILMNNDGGDILGYSMPFAIYSPDGSISTITHRDVGGFGDFSSIHMTPDYLSIWNLMNEWTGFGWDGNLPDSINHTPISLSGWVAGLGEQLNIQFALQVEQAGTLCIDSISVPNVTPTGMYDWLFDYPSAFGGPYCWTFSCPDDFDCDGILDSEDNCPNISNVDQADSDGDEIGNVCDDCPDDPNNDIDNDGICGDVDNCPDTENSNQADEDSDTVGDLCDNCPDEANTDQANDDGDDFGNACDNCPNITNEDQADTDSDNVGNLCDNCPDMANENQLNSDSDTHGDVCDNCPGITNEDQADSDGDNIGDLCDDCPDDPDNDADGDDICGDIDNCPDTYNPDQADPDADDVGTLCDNCPDDYNPGQEDSNGNGIGDACEEGNRTWYVKVDGTGDSPTIQAAIDSSINGDTVLVAEGVYTGEGNRDIDFTGKLILVISESGPDVTVIDCLGTESEPHFGVIFQGAIFLNDEDSNAILEGFTIRNGFNGGHGGAVRIMGASPQIIGCVFSGNTAYPSSGYSVGGAIYAYLSGFTIIKDCVFLKNEATSGGAIYSTEGTMILENCIFEGNKGHQGPGGGIYCYESEITLNKCLFDGNAASTGFAIYGYDSQLGIDNCTFAFNTADTIIADNATIYCHDSTILNMNKSIIAFNTEGDPVLCGGFDVELSVSCTDIFGNESGDWIGCLGGFESINGNLSADPLFCDTLDHDFHLELISECAADNNSCGELIGAYNIACGGLWTNIAPGIIYGIFLNSIDSMYAEITLTDMDDNYSVYDVDTNSIKVNGTIIPQSFEFVDLPEEQTGLLKILVSMNAFIESYMVLWDTIMPDYTVTWEYYDQTQGSIHGTVTMVGHISGDVNGDNIINMLDMTYIINYIYKHGQEPLPIVENGDVDNTGTVNLRDITYLIMYLLKEGPAPVSMGDRQ